MDWGAPRASSRLPHLPGVDGLRAVAVAAVLLYHADVAWLPAGFLGVDVFFVISGYLITSLLVAEHAATGTVALGRFWLRRARRLLPALFALLVGVSIAAVVVARDAAGPLAGDLPAAVGYVSNWWQVLRGESYFDSFGRPPLLRHLWSLAVEEQFYVVAPLAIGAALRPHRRRRALLGVTALVLAGGSALLMAALWSPVDPSRAYYGTDTRAAPLLLGVALGAWWRPYRLRPRVAAPARAVLDLAGLGALAGLGVLVATADEFGSGLYRGGLLLAAALAAVAVAVAAHPATRLSLLLGARPLVALGRRSYSIYLWHWPVVVLTRPGLDVPIDGAPLLAVRVAASLALAEVSYRWIEQPFRDGRVQRAFRVRRAPERRRLTAAVLGASMAGWLGVALVAVPTEADLVVVSSSVKGEAATTLATWPSSTTTEPARKKQAPVTTSTTAVPTTTTTLPAGPPVGPILAIGDSVLLAGATALERASEGVVQVDAEVGRQVWDLLERLDHYRRAGTLGQLTALVVHLGTNGPLAPRDLDRLAVAVAGIPRVVILNVRVPRRWEETTNATLRDNVARFPEMRLADWYTASGQPGMLIEDGVHPSPAGMVTYARIVLDQLTGLAPRA